MDMQMPIMDGYETTRQIKTSAQGQNTVIIAVTASVFEENRQHVLAAGCDDFVRKPIYINEVMEKMATHLGVEYCRPATAIAPPPARGAAAPPSASTEIPDLHLDVMPAVWQQQLEQAALQGDDAWIMKLIDQIPADHQALIDGLTRLVQSFRFDQVIALTQLVAKS
jgi:CheY-like chemotaxis protein